MCSYVYLLAVSTCVYTGRHLPCAPVAAILEFQCDQNAYVLLSELLRKIPTKREIKTRL